MPTDRRRAPLGRLLVEVVRERETLSGYVAGWVGRVDGEPVGLVRSRPEHARHDLLAFALSATGADGAGLGNTPGTFA